MLLFALYMFGCGVWQTYQLGDIRFLLAGLFIAYFFAWGALQNTPWELPAISQLTERSGQRLRVSLRSK
jgi:hypothetical protein